MSACPPAPNYARTVGISDCEYLQLTPFEKTRLEKVLTKGQPIVTPQPSYLIGAYTMDHASVAAYLRQSRNNSRAVGLYRNPHHVGRTAFLGGRWDHTKIATETRRASTRSGPLSVSGSYRNLDDPNFHKDVWSMAAYTKWLTDGRAWSADTHPNAQAQIGKLSAAGKNTDSLSEVVGNTSTGRAKENLAFMERIYGSAVYGPDGIFGGQMEDVLVDYINSGGKIFGKTVPAQGRKVFDRLKAGVSTPDINSANRAPTGISAGGIETGIPCNELSRELRVERGCPIDAAPGEGDSGIDEGALTPAEPEGFLGGMGDINWLLWGGIGAATLLGVTGGVLYYRKKKGLGATRRMTA